MPDPYSLWIIAVIVAVANTACLLIAAIRLKHHGYDSYSQRLKKLSGACLLIAILLLIMLPCLRGNLVFGPLVCAGLALLAVICCWNAFLPTLIARGRGLSNSRSVLLVNVVGLLFPPVWFFALSAALGDPLLAASDSGAITDPVQTLPQLIPQRKALHLQIEALIETFGQNGASELAAKLRRAESAVFVGKDSIPEVKRIVQFAFLEREWPDATLDEMRALIESVEAFESTY